MAKRIVMERLLEEVKVMSEPSLVFWIRQAVTKCEGEGRYELLTFDH